MDRSSRALRFGREGLVVLGERDDVGLTDEERRGLEECPGTTLVPIPAAGHFTMNEEPGQIAELILEMVAADAGR